MDGSCQPSGENPLGPVSMGMLRIQSKIAPVFVEECEGPASDVDANNGIFENYGIYEQKRNGKTYHLVLRSVTLRSLIRAIREPGLSEGPDSLIKRPNFKIIYNFLIQNKGQILIK